MRNENPSLSMKAALPVLVGDLEQMQIHQPGDIVEFYDLDGLSYEVPPNCDWFGNFAFDTYKSWNQSTREYLNRQKPVVGAGAVADLDIQLHVARGGIGVISMYTEVAPLVYMRETEEDLSPEVARDLTLRGYSFIEKLILSGEKSAGNLVMNYFDLDKSLDFLSSADGVIVGSMLFRPKRLDNFTLIEEKDGTVVLPNGFDKTLEVAKEYHYEENKVPVTCPAHIYRDRNGLTYTRRLFDLMVNYAAKHIYPSYLPLARKVLSETVKV